MRTGTIRPRKSISCMVKGNLEEYFAQLDCLNRVRFEPLTDIEKLHPGQTARILLDGEAIGLIGKVHPTVQKH